MGTKAAYAAAATITRARMQEEAPLAAEALASVQAADVVVVPGCYDHVENVLAALEMPHTSVSPGQLGQVELDPRQLLVINCPGTGLERAIPRIREFVNAGGSLFTTDWALTHVVEAAFPGYIAYNQRPTRDDVVRIEIKDRENPFVQGVMSPDADPQWWLEGSSYPIKVLRPEVNVLITSKDMEEKYGEAAIAVTFNVGRGELFHLVSHYYLQRTELRNARHKQDAGSYAKELGFDATKDAMVYAAMSGLNLGEVESATSSARLFSNVVARKAMRNKGQVK